MIDIGVECHRLLAEAGVASVDVDGSARALVFEGSTVLGFVVIYPDADELRHAWVSDTNALISKYQFGLRRAEAKAWNTYIVLLTGDVPNYAGQVALSAIEEDLAGTRKLARAGITSADALRTALLPLLPIQNAPRLGVVDMRREIQLRTTELPSRAVEAFLSGVSIAVVAQTLEELP